MDECKNYNILQGFSLFMTFIIFGYSILKKKLYDKSHLKSEDNIINKLKGELMNFNMTYKDLDNFININNINNKDEQEKKTSKDKN